MDITELILEQHHEQRRTFAMLDDIALHDEERLAAVWARLEVLLEVHAKAEELYFYPRLLELGTGVDDQDGPGEEVEDAIHDHNEIRDGITAARRHRAGTDEWWAAVRAARVANSDHMAEEEREDLADFRRHADLATRHEIALQFIAFESEHATGIPVENQDPGEYVEHGGR